jgi:hypothetical protein
MMILFVMGGILSTPRVRLQRRSASGPHFTFSPAPETFRLALAHGIKPRNLLITAGVAVLIFVFLYAATAQISPLTSKFLPWYLAGLGIGTFNVLQQLRLVFPSEEAFLTDYREASGQFVPPPSRPVDPNWQRVIRATYSGMFFAAWLGFLAFFYYSGTAFREGSPIATAAQPDILTEHGKTVYITHSQKMLNDKLELFGFTGIPSIMVGGLLIHFLAGVKLYPNLPTLRGLLGKKTSGGLTGGKYLINAHTGNGLITSLAANWEFGSR